MSWIGRIDRVAAHQPPANASARTAEPPSDSDQHNRRNAARSSAILTPTRIARFLDVKRTYSRAFPRVRRARQSPEGSRSGATRPSGALGRSEEHTSELQSPCNLVCRLLLDKKNNGKN